MAAVSCGSDSGEHRPQLRLLLLGGPRAGKSCSGNTILGEEVFQTGEETVHSMVIYKEGRGRRLTVVDTPPWACPTDTTAGGDGVDGGGDDDGVVEGGGGGGGDVDGAAVQSEQASIEGPFMGAILCPPGPHALLLVMSASQPFTEVHRRAAEDQVEALGGGAWRHCMLIFTGVDQLPKGTFVEEYIESTGEALQWLVERCGSRYHALDNTLKGGKEDTQVQELLEKVEELVEENQGWYFEFNELTLLEEEHARKALEEERRRMEEQERLRPSMVGGPPRELRVLLLGWKGVGKSSVGNAILGRRDFESGMETELCMRRQALVHGRRVTVVDTPGWDWFSVRRTPRRIRQEIKRGGALLYPGPHSILLVLPVVCSLSTRKRRTLEAHIDALFGDKACLHTMLLFSCGDWLGRTPIEEHIQRGGRELHSLLEYCGNYYHVMDSKTPVKDSRSVSDLLDKIEEMSRDNGDEAFLPIPMNSDSESSDNTSPEDDCRGCQLQ